MLPINMRARGPRGPHSWAVSTPEYRFQWGDEKYQAFCSWSQETTQPRLQATAGGVGLGDLLLLWPLEEGSIIPSHPLRTVTPQWCRAQDSPRNPVDCKHHKQNCSLGFNIRFLQYFQTKPTKNRSLQKERADTHHSPGASTRWAMFSCAAHSTFYLPILSWGSPESKHLPAQTNLLTPVPQTPTGRHQCPSRHSPHFPTQAESSPGMGPVELTAAPQPSELPHGVQPPSLCTLQAWCFPRPPAQQTPLA